MARRAGCAARVDAEHVFDRVQADYQSRLQRVDEQLVVAPARDRRRADEFADRASRCLRRKNSCAATSAPNSSCARTSASSPARRPIAAFHAVDETIRQLVEQKNAVTARIAELNALINFKPVAAVPPAPEAPPAETAADDRAATKGGTVATPGGTFDEMAFLSEVVGEEARRAAETAPQPKPSAPAAAPVPVAAPPVVAAPVVAAPVVAAPVVAAPVVAAPIAAPVAAAPRVAGPPVVAPPIAAPPAAAPPPSAQPWATVTGGPQSTGAPNRAGNGIGAGPGSGIVRSAEIGEPPRAPLGPRRSATGTAAGPAAGGMRRDEPAESLLAGLEQANRVAAARCAARRECVGEHADRAAATAVTGADQDAQVQRVRRDELSDGVVLRALRRGARGAVSPPPQHDARAHAQQQQSARQSDRRALLFMHLDSARALRGRLARAALVAGRGVAMDQSLAGGAVEQLGRGESGSRRSRRAPWPSSAQSAGRNVAHGCARSPRATYACSSWRMRYSARNNSPKVSEILGIPRRLKLREPGWSESQGSDNALTLLVRSLRFAPIALRPSGPSVLFARGLIEPPRSAKPTLHFQDLLLFVPVLLFSVIAHEYAHGYAALKQGDDTALMLGRLTWNPVKHIDPFMTVLLPAMLFFASHGTMMLGGAKPVPVNPRELSQLQTRRHHRVARRRVCESAHRDSRRSSLFVLIGLLGRVAPAADASARHRAGDDVARRAAQPAARSRSI